MKELVNQQVVKVGHKQVSLITLSRFGQQALPIFQINWKKRNFYLLNYCFALEEQV
jgi:hypothetical protein